MVTRKFEDILIDKNGNVSLLCHDEDIENDELLSVTKFRESFHITTYQECRMKNLSQVQALSIMVDSFPLPDEEVITSERDLATGRLLVLEQKVALEKINIIELEKKLPLSEL